MKNKYSRYKVMYIITEILLCMLGFFYTVCAVEKLLKGDMFSFLTFMIPSIIFYTFSCQSVIYIWHIFEWLEIAEEKEIKIEKNINYFSYTDEENIMIAIVILTVPIVIKGNKLINSLVSEIILSDDFRVLVNNTKVKISIDEEGEE